MRMIKFVKYESVVIWFLFLFVIKCKFVKFVFIRLYKNIVNFSFFLCFNVLWLV